MRPEIDLFLLRDSLVQLAETTYFGTALHKFTSKLIEVIDHVVRDSSSYPEVTIRGFAQRVRQSHQYLSGSTTKDSPYELAFCLENAVRSWVKKDTIITTGLTYGQNFHFLPDDPWEFIKLSITGFAVDNYDPKLIFIGVPGLYVHKPLYCIPLFHELGHFVDVSLSVSQYSSLMAPTLLSASTPPYPLPILHRMEHFADLFSACYVGRSGVETLETIAPNDPPSATHPATADRVKVVDDFLAGTHSNIIELFQRSLSALGAPQLTPHFVVPSITADFDDIRPYEVRSVQELFGLFDAAWKYLIGELDNKRATWASAATVPAIEQIVNDLTEKSIRNYAMVERWARGNP